MLPLSLYKLSETVFWNKPTVSDSEVMEGVYFWNILVNYKFYIWTDILMLPLQTELQEIWNQRNEVKVSLIINDDNYFQSFFTTGHKSDWKQSLWHCCKTFWISKIIYSVGAKSMQWKRQSWSSKSTTAAVGQKALIQCINLYLLKIEG